MKDYQNIIIRLPNWIGDLIMATPLLEDLAKAYPHARLTAMARTPLADLLIGNPFIHEIFSFTRSNEFLRRIENRNVIERLRQGKYDLGILTTNSLSSAWWFWRGRVRQRLGYGKGRTLLLTNPLPFPPERGKEHLVITYKRLLAPLGIPLSASAPALFSTEAEKAEARKFLEKFVPPGGRLIGINPGAAYGSAKCWLPERFRALTERLLEDERTVILYFGDQAGASLAARICAELPPRVMNLAGKTSIRQLIALIASCHAFLTNDSGPMHMAAALKVPLVALFGSTSPVATGPYGGGKVLQKQVSCAPCYKRVCPIDFRCMRGITVDQVYAALMEKLFT